MNFSEEMDNKYGVQVTASFVVCELLNATSLMDTKQKIAVITEVMQALEVEVDKLR
jgi:K+ transporter